MTLVRDHKYEGQEDIFIVRSLRIDLCVDGVYFWCKVRRNVGPHRYTNLIPATNTYLLFVRLETRGQGTTDRILVSPPFGGTWYSCPRYKISATTFFHLPWSQGVWDLDGVSGPDTCHLRLYSYLREQIRSQGNKREYGRLRNRFFSNFSF